jgi:hypothetical protein
VEDRN